MTSSEASRLHVLTVRMREDEHAALRHYAHLTSRSVNQVVVAAIRRLLRQEVGDAEFDVVLAQVREELRSTLDRMGDD
jgi:uncharacterized protein (DUF1778 family)